MLADAKSQLLVEGYSATRSTSRLLEEDGSGRHSRTSRQPSFAVELTAEQEAMIKERDDQRRTHRRIMSDLYSVIQVRAAAIAAT